MEETKVKGLIEAIQEIEELQDAFKRELGRPSLASFRRMRKLTVQMGKVFRAFRKFSPKQKDELEAFLREWRKIE